MRKMSFVFLLVSLLFLGTVDFCSAQQTYGLSPEVSRWEIDVESGQLWSVGRDRGFRHHRFERTKDYRMPVSLPEGRVLKPEEENTILGIIKNDFLVNDDTTSGCSQYFPAVAMAASGNFVICWHDKRNSLGGDIYAQRYNSSGDTMEANFRVVESNGGYCPSTAMDRDGNFVICWCDSSKIPPDIYAQRYSSSGDTIGVNFRVNDDAGTNDQERPAVAMDGDGEFVICWTDNRYDWNDIWAQQYDGLGNTIGVNFRVNNNIGEFGSWSSPSIAMDVDGNFVICWENSYNGDQGIYAQRYDSLGNALGANFRVSNNVGGCWHPSIAMNAHGDFVICWQDWRNGWDNPDIYAQRYDASGNALGTNFQVNDDTGTSEQSHPSVSIDTNGNFVICWQDKRNGDWDIYAQRYHSDGTSWGANYLVNQRPDVPNPNQWDPSIAVSNDRIVFSWVDMRRSEGSDIYAKVVTWDWEKVEEPSDEDVLPKDFALFQNYPNPFNSATTIRYTLPDREGRPHHTALKIYNILGQKIRTLVDEKQPPGNYSILWDGKDENGDQVSSGIYFYRLEAGNFCQVRKMVLLR